MASASNINKYAGKLDIGTNLVLYNTGEILCKEGDLVIESLSGDCIFKSNQSTLTLSNESISFSGDKGISFTKSAVTQITSSVNPVTINTSCGVITTYPSSLTANSSKKFTVNNTSISSDSVIICKVSDYTGTGIPVTRCGDIINNSFSITISNSHISAPLNSIIKISFIAV